MNSIEFHSKPWSFIKQFIIANVIVLINWPLWLGVYILYLYLCILILVFEHSRVNIKFLLKTRYYLNYQFKKKVASLRPFGLGHFLTDLDGVWALAASHMGESTQIVTTEDRVLVDIGAHFGFVSVGLALRYPKARIIAVEPHPENYKILKQNISLNGVQNVEAYNLAISDFDGIASLISDGLTATSYRVTFYRTYDDKGIACRKLQTFLDQVIRINTVDYLKLDIEGEETRVLRDSVPRILNCKKLDIEVHELKDLKEIIDLLYKNGWVVIVSKLSRRTTHIIGLRINESKNNKLSRRAKLRVGSF